jgi:hypothetical protein
LDQNDAYIEEPMEAIYILLGETTGYGNIEIRRKVDCMG